MVPMKRQWTTEELISHFTLSSKELDILPQRFLPLLLLLITLYFLPGAPLPFQFSANRFSGRKIFRHRRPQPFECVTDLAANAIMRLNGGIFSHDLLSAQSAFCLRDPEEVCCEFFTPHVV